jgi:hypothetical protein
MIGFYLFESIYLKLLPLFAIIFFIIWVLMSILNLKLLSYLPQNKKKKLLSSKSIISRLFNQPSYGKLIKYYWNNADFEDFRIKRIKKIMRLLISIEIVLAILMILPFFIIFLPEFIRT